MSICDLYLCTKSSRKPPVREFHFIPIPDAQWNTLSIDFVIELLESFGYNTVMMVVNSVSKRVYFIPAYTIVTAGGVAKLFLHQVWKLYRLSRHIILDYRPQFIVLFTKKLYYLLEIQLVFSMAQHPQTDGQTECVNQELDQYLCFFINE